jgi:hypothetical protein
MTCNPTGFGNARKFLIVHWDRKVFKKLDLILDFLQNSHESSHSIARNFVGFKDGQSFVPKSYIVKIPIVLHSYKIS